MRCEGPFRFELTGAPELRFDGRVIGGMVQIFVDDTADDVSINSVPLFCDRALADRLERAVAAFNAEMLRETSPVKEAAE